MLSLGLGGSIGNVVRVSGQTFALLPGNHLPPFLDPICNVCSDHKSVLHHRASPVIGNFAKDG